MDVGSGERAAHLFYGHGMFWLCIEGAIAKKMCHFEERFRSAYPIDKTIGKRLLGG